MKKRLIHVNSTSGWSVVAEIDVTILSPLARDSVLELTKRDTCGDYHVIAVTLEDNVITHGWK